MQLMHKEATGSRGLRIDQQKGDTWHRHQRRERGLQVSRIPSLSRLPCSFLAFIFPLLLSRSFHSFPFFSPFLVCFLSSMSTLAASEVSLDESIYSFLCYISFWVFSHSIISHVLLFHLGRHFHASSTLLSPSSWQPCVTGSYTSGA